MAQLHEQLAAAVEAWRKQGYPCEAYPTISEILEWSHDAETGSLRYLRRPQFRAPRSRSMVRFRSQRQ